LNALTTAIAAVVAAVGAALALPVAARVAFEDERTCARPARSADQRAPLARFRALLACLSVAGGWVVIGGLLGVVIGLVGAVLSWRAVSRLESPAAARHRQELTRDLPTAVHLLGACLAAGSAVGSALAAVAESMPGAVGDELALIQRRLHWGVDPATVWRTVDGPLEPLGRSMARAHESGASVRHAVDRLNQELRHETRARADSRARAVEVRAAAPLGLCFLPAFVLIGVVPMVAGLFSSLAFFR